VHKKLYLLYVFLIHITSLYSNPKYHLVKFSQFSLFCYFLIFLKHKLIIYICFSFSVFPLLLSSCIFETRIGNLYMHCFLSGMYPFKIDQYSYRRDVRISKDSKVRYILLQVNNMWGWNELMIYKVNGTYQTFGSFSGMIQLFLSLNAKRNEVLQILKR
jgi:hypothetical protein